ncbi:MAG: hypothetical protein MUP31_01210 [Xanthomonadales bacterium]|nr:hypothetical protein [Xanthomonadales bacterium]
MITKTIPFSISGSIKLAIGLSMVCATLTLASCASTRNSSPVQVAASNPTVTYKYRNDDELIQANQQAMTFCQQYQALPRAQSFAHDSDSRNIVVFECVASSMFAAPAARRPDSDLAYNFRTDQDLLDVSRDAQVYCLNNGAPEMNSDITVHSNGSKTVTFHCSTR